MSDPKDVRRGLLARLSQSAEFGSFTKWVFLSALVGFAGGVAAWAFRIMIEFTTEWLFRRPTGLAGDGLGPGGPPWWLILLIPTAGGAVVGFIIQQWAPEAEGHGTDSVVRAYHRLKGVVRQRVIYLKALTSAITIGSGGSAGQEGPVAQVGAGVGSSIASALKLSDRDRRLFLMSGATAGVGAMFCSPLGGALFMPEVLYRKAEFEGEAIIPCIISSIFAYATFTTISGEHRAVHIDEAVLAQLSFDNPAQLIVYLVLGIACAFFGWLYTHVFYGVHSGFERMTSVSRRYRPAIGGLCMGLVALAVAPFAAGGGGVFFGGYGLMQASIGGSLTIQALIALILAKILATSFTISSGGSGGVFAPALAIGAMVGALVGEAADQLVPAFDVNPACFALVGMGGFFAGVAKAPIASVIMVSEMTGSYSLLAPLMLVAVVHMMLSTGWTLYRAQVPSPIDSPAHVGDFVIDVLQGIQVSDILGDARPPRLIHEDVTLKGAMRIVSDSHETHFPVVDDDDELVGIFSLTDLRRIFLMDVVEDMIIVRDFMNEQVTTVKMGDSLHQVQRIMTRRGVSAVPVVDAENPRKVVALLERNLVGRAYAEKLAAMKAGG